jgi:hypothetical protein
MRLAAPVHLPQRKKDPAMTQERTQGGAPKPPRAEPLQPDRPGRGTERHAPDTAGQKSDDEAKRLAEQEKTAVENTREGYR